MKKYILLIIPLFFALNCIAQDTVVKKGWLTESVLEKYHVLKTDKQTKQGLYQATINGKIPLASGNYKDGKRVGVWHFYDTNGQIIQNFNYDTQTVLYEEPITEFTETKIAYAFDTTFTNADRVTKPIKPGGRSFGYINYIRLYRLTMDTYNIDPSQVTAVLEVLVSPGGRLADLKVHIKLADGERITTFSPELFDDDDKLFIPATINGQPILCRIFVRCRLTPYGELDLY